MKILLAFPQKDKQTGLFILKAFRNLGNKVFCLDAKLEARKLFNRTKKCKPEVIFMSRTENFFPYVIKIKENFPNIKLICWNVDKRNDVKEFNPKLLNLFNECHLLYTIALGNVEQYQKLFPKTIVKHLQQGCDPETHKTELFTEEKYQCDVMFAGSIQSCGGQIVRKQRENLFQSIKENFNFKFYETKKNPVYDTEANKAYQSAKIVIGHNGWANVDISMSVRDYKVMGAGGFLLTEYCQGIENWFDLGKDCETYKTTEECLDKIKYYLSHPKERKKIALQGQKTVYEKHKYIDRIKIVQEDIRKLIIASC